MSARTNCSTPRSSWDTTQYWSRVEKEGLLIPDKFEGCSLCKKQCSEYHVWHNKFQKILTKQMNSMKTDESTALYQEEEFRPACWHGIATPWQ
jgi:hypothetical protein